jgi:septum formation protein
LKLILASASPRRKQLLEKLALVFEVKVSNVVETLDPQLTPYQNTVKLAAEKAKAVATSVMSESPEPAGGIKVLGGDTLVIIDNQCLGQPKTAEAAVEMLQLLSGKWHDVCTGVALIEITGADGNENSCVDAACFPQQSAQIMVCSESMLKYTLAYEVSKVKMRQLSKTEIESYVHTGESFGVAGSYALQGIGAALVERVEGCVSNVIGLPLPLVTKMLRTAGITVLGEPKETRL